MTRIPPTEARLTPTVIGEGNGPQEEGEDREISLEDIAELPLLTE